MNLYLVCNIRYFNLIASTLNHFSYPKGLIVAFTLKSASEASADKNGAGTAPTDAGTKTDEEKESSENATEGIEKEAENVKNNEGKTEEKNGSDDKEKDGGDGEKSLEASAEKGEEKKNKPDQKEEKSAIDTYKNNMDVVLREDLKRVFQRFGNVKVIMVYFYFTVNIISSLVFLVILELEQSYSCQ